MDKDYEFRKIVTDSRTFEDALKLDLLKKGYEKGRRDIATKIYEDLKFATTSLKKKEGIIGFLQEKTMRILEKELSIN